MQKFNWEDFENGKIAVNCDTEENAENFIEICLLRGLKWVNCKDGIYTYWKNHKENTAYCCFRGFKDIGYSNKKYYKTKGITVLKFEDIFKIEEKLVNEDAIKPSHYKAGEFDVIAFCQKHDLSFDVGNVIKYVTRAGKKKDNSELQDLNKAMEYLKRRIEFVKGDK